MHVYHSVSSLYKYVLIPRFLQSIRSSKAAS
jgi:hypothetical protein